MLAALCKEGWCVRLGQWDSGAGRCVRVGETV